MTISSMLPFELQLVFDLKKHQCWKNTLSFKKKKKKSKEELKLLQNSNQIKQIQAQPPRSCSKMTVGVRSVKCFSNCCTFTPTRAPTVITSLSHLSYDAATQRSVTAPNCSLVFLALNCTLSGQLHLSGPLQSGCVSLCGNLFLHQSWGKKGPIEGI